MLSYVSGKVISLNPTQVVMENNGFGYQLHISLNTFAQIEGKKECQLFTYLNVRIENQSVAGFDLYGFADQKEQALFELLISVSGIGANTARMALSSMKAQELQHAIMMENVDAIKSVKGIGPKTAKRIILELKDKALALGGADENVLTPLNNTSNDEALMALMSLGFGKPAAEKAIKKVIAGGEGDGVESIIKAALKIL